MQKWTVQDRTQRKRMQRKFGEFTEDCEECEEYDVENNDEKESLIMTQPSP